MHTLRQLEAEEGIHNKGYAAFAGLAVNTDDRLILSSDIAWIDRQIWNLPVLAVAFFKSLHAFIDSILMRTGECSKYQLTGIWMSLRNIHLGAALVNLCDLTNILDLQLRIDALGEHVISQGQNIDITGTLAIAE